MAAIHTYIDPIKRILPNPLIASLATGGLIYGTSRLAYPLVSGAMSHMGSRFGMDSTSIGELTEELDSPDSKKKIPLVLAALSTAAMLASNYDGTSKVKYGGLLSSWDDPNRGISKDASFGIMSQLHDQTDINFGKLLPVRTTKDIIMNDPNAAIYQKGNALDIINKASGFKNNGTMTAGALFDSTLNKVQQNLTLGGITNAAVRGVIGYGMAKAFTGAVGSLIDMPKSVRDGIVTSGMITNIIQGLD